MGRKQRVPRNSILWVETFELVRGELLMMPILYYDIIVLLY